jgi:predicted DNA-binding transcriptional regulator AlpA
MFQNDQGCAVLDAPEEVDAEFVERREVLARLGVTRPTLARWIASGAFPPPLGRWPGRSPRWRREVVQKFFDEMN